MLGRGTGVVCKWAAEQIFTGDRGVCSTRGDFWEVGRRDWSIAPY